MKYTENYHLPQWDEDDRIMRVDFNRMCADIEAGLTETAQTTESVSQNSAALEEKNLRRLCRMALNHFNAVQNSSSWQAGMFYQNPAKSFPDPNGMTTWNGVYFSGTGSTSIVRDDLSDYTVQLAPLKIVKNNLAASSPLMVSFCVPGPAYMSRINLCGSYSNNVAGTPSPARLTLTNQNTGEIEVVQNIDIAQGSTHGALFNGLVDAFVPFHGGVPYMLKIEPLAAVYDAELSLNTDASQSPLQAVTKNKPISVTHTIQEYEGSSGGLLIVRGVVNGTDGKLTVKWDGKEVQLHTTRMVRISDGRQVREMVYFRNEPVPAETTFSLQFENGTCSSFLFYDWGAILL